MTEFLELTFRSFWHFVGMTILLNGLAYFIINCIIKIYGRTMRCLMVRKHGWPPSHLDADGDWKPEPKINEDDN